jgi:ABC-type glycerol-3-phosphate transport system permease component
VAAPEIALFVVCLCCLACAAFAIARLRMRMSKHRGAALTFAVPGALLILPGGWLAAHGDLFALATIALLCFAAAARFVPTAATRFAAFERQFWAHVNRGS